VEGGSMTVGRRQLRVEFSLDDFLLEGEPLLRGSVLYCA
jgi:hypothetical protein